MTIFVFVAGASRLQRKELTLQSVPTLELRAKLPLPIPFNPSSGSREGYTRIREQARIQMEVRTEGRCRRRNRVYLVSFGNFCSPRFSTDFSGIRRGLVGHLSCRSLMQGKADHGEQSVDSHFFSLRVARDIPRRGSKGTGCTRRGGIALPAP